MHYDSLDDFLTELPALAASVEDKLRVQNGLFLVKLPKRQVCIRLEDGAVRVERRTDEYPNCIIEADEQLLLPVQQRVARESIPCGKDRRTRIVKAQLGNRAGLIGAALLGKNKRI